MVLNNDSVKLVFHSKIMTKKGIIFWIKIANDSQWKLGVITECIGKGMLHKNQLTKLGFVDISGKVRTMMVQANLPKEIKYKLCKECFSYATYLSIKAAVTDTRNEHFHKAKLFYAKHLRI